MRLRYQEIQRLVAEFRSSGLRQSEFCRIHGLTHGPLEARPQQRADRLRPLSSARIRSHDFLTKAGRDLWHDSNVIPAAPIFFQLIADFVVYLGLLIRPRKAIAAENLFLRGQLALYQERKVHPRRIDPATRITLALLSRLFNWRATNLHRKQFGRVAAL